MGSKAGLRRLEDLDERALYAATELQAIEEEELPAETRIGDEDFDNVAWMEAELEATIQERNRTVEVVTVSGGVTYEEP